MSGSRVPYHLRHNKAIDRNLFLELLTMINRYTNVSKYTYVGFGGAFLEDFKLIHNHTGIKSMVSIEQEEEVVKRQKFNSPAKCIKYRHIKSEELIENFDINKSAIIWLDYASPRELSGQLNEIQTLVPKLKNNDILRVTLNANPATLFQEKDLSAGEDLKERRYEVLEERAGNYMLGEDKDEITTQLNATNYPKILCRILKFAINKGMEGRQSFFQPLTAFAYNDSFHTMLTFCGIVLDRTDKKEFLKKTGIKKWKLNSMDGIDTHKINIPELSIRERLFIDSLLPNYSAESILRKLKFNIGKNEEETLEQLKNYVNFYRHYPYFSKVLP